MMRLSILPFLDPEQDLAEPLFLENRGMTNPLHRAAISASCGCSEQQAGGKHSAALANTNVAELVDPSDRPMQVAVVGRRLGKAAIRSEWDQRSRIVVSSAQEGSRRSSAGRQLLKVFLNGDSGTALL